jgi:PTH1 family peptidyl-tRNA hydrolase
MVVDKFAAIHSFSFSRRKFKSKIASGLLSGKEILLVKPQTFMNLSGESVGSFVRFFKSELSDILIVYDDIDIPFGNIRLRPSGGAGGHKGLESIIAHFGSNEVPRLRIGIRGATPVRDLSSYVLKKFSSEERAELDDVIQRACDAVEAVVSGSFEKAMNRYN